jgi:hypothetical protein
MNPLFNQLNQNNNIISQFNQFRQNFQGDPQQAVQNLLNSGRVSQEQYNQAVNKANQLAHMLGMS